MGSVDNGNQILSYDYKEEAKGIKFNRINYKIAPRGVYYGGTFTKVDDSLINMSTMMLVVEDATSGVAVRIETSSVASVSVSNATPIIIGRFTWLNVENNYMDFLAVAEGSILSSDIILGKCVYAGAVLSSTFDYSRRMWNFNYYNNINIDSIMFKVEANEPYGTKVKVYPGTAVINGKKITIATITQSPDFTSASSNGRKDILRIDKNGTLSIQQGIDTPGAPLPIMDNSYLSIAIIEFPALATVVKGEYITYIYPYFHFSGQLNSTSSTTFQIDKDNNGPLLKNNSGPLEVRVYDDSALSILRVAEPVGSTDVATKNYIDTNTKSLRNYISGLNITNNGSDLNNDIDIDVGVAQDSTNTYTMYLNSLLTKQLDAAWVAGTNQGGLFSGSKAATTIYYIHLIRKDSDGSIDVGFDTSITAANKPAGYSNYRCIGSFITNASSNIRNGKYIRYNNILHFIYNDFVLDRAYSSLSGTSRILITTSVLPNCIGIYSLFLNGSVGASYVNYGSPYETDIVPSNFDTAKIRIDFGDSLWDCQLEYIVNSSSQIYIRADTGSGVYASLKTEGYKQIC